MLSRYALTLATALGCIAPIIAAPSAQAQQADVSNEYKREMAALEEAFTVMQTVKDESSAKKAAQRIITLFRNLPPIMGGSDSDILALAKAQNRVSNIMWSLVNEPYFESSGLQTAWSIMTDTLTRPVSQK